MPDSEVDKRSTLYFPIIGALLFFLVLCWLDFPKPMWDDLFYTGAGIHLADGGDFSNPLLARQGFPSHFYYMFPPVHSYALYGWLSVWGISAGSLLAFQALMYFIIAAAMILILRRAKAPVILAWLAPLAVNAVFIKVGLRPEPFAVALTMTGYTALLFCRRSHFALFFSFGLIFLGGLTAPRIAFFGAALVLTEGFRLLKENKKSSWLPIGLWAIAAFIATVLIFLVLIHFQVAEFLKTIRFHATRPPAIHPFRVDGATWELLHKFFYELGSKWWPIFLLTAVLLGYSALRPANECSRFCYWLALVFPLAALAGFLGPGSSWFVIVILFLLTANMWINCSKAWRRTLAAALIFTMLLANSTTLIEACGLVVGKIHPQQPNNRAEIIALAKQRPVLIDSAVARYVFNYRFPSGTVDYGFSAPFPNYAAIDAKLQPDDIYVLGPNTAAFFNQILHPDYKLVRWNPFGVKNWSQIQYPCEAFIIPAKDFVGMNFKELEK